MRMRRPARGGSFRKQQTGVIAPRSADSAPKETFGWPLLVTSALQAIRDRPLIRGRRGCGRRPGKDDRAGATKVNGAGSLGGGRSPLRAAGRTCPPSTRAAARGPPSAATDRPGSRTAGDAPSSRPLLRRPRLSCSSGNVLPRCPSPTLNLFSPKPTSEWLSLKSPAS